MSGLGDGERSGDGVSLGLGLGLPSGEGLGEKLSAGLGDAVVPGVGDGDGDGFFLRFDDGDGDGELFGLGVTEGVGVPARGVTEAAEPSFGDGLREDFFGLAFGFGDGVGVAGGFFVAVGVFRFFFGGGVGSKSRLTLEPSDSSASSRCGRLAKTIARARSNTVVDVQRRLRAAM